MKVLKYIGGALMLASLVACGSLNAITDDGQLQDKNHIVWPKISKSHFSNEGHEGTWPNWANVDMIEAGMNKPQLYHLIGEPHFSEGFIRVREWNYVFNYRENGEHKICQYKILFDKDMLAQSFFWKPEGCRKVNKIRLSSDFLFDFDKDILVSQASDVLDNLVSELKTKNVHKVKIVGYTDYLGSDLYNLALSKRRALAVKNYLLTHGLEGVEIVTIARGEASPVVSCSGETGEKLRACLKPNRRVEIIAE